MAKWILRNKTARKEEISKVFGISFIFSTVLANRNILTKRGLETYLNPDLEKLHNILEMKDVEKAFILLDKAINENKKICIYGDYDVDGVTSTTIMYKGLKALGANVFYYIPDREEEGYGLNINSIDKVKQMGAELIFTCDNGIASIDEVEYIKTNGMNIIILDHHEPKFLENKEDKKQDIIPNADAVIDTKRSDCTYPFKYLCTAGLSYKFIKEFFQFKREEFLLEEELLVFASIGTICDIVDLVDENRIIAKAGIDILNKNNKINLGLSQIILLKGLEEKEIDENTYGFSIGPCINASGRLEHALKAVELFTTHDEKKSYKIASELINLNDRRKEMTLEGFSKISEKIENTSLKDDKILVIFEPEVHESIAGIIAGRIKEKYYKPTIVITSSKHCCKGSARSIENYNIFEELLKVKHLFEKFGGHAMAAGLSLKEENIEVLKQELNKNQNLKEEDLIEKIEIDKVLDFNQININLARELDFMKPVGKENKKAIFATKNVFIKNIKFIGKEKNILKLQLEDAKKNIQDAISFNIFEKLKNILKNQIGEEEFNEIYLGYKKSIDLSFDVVYSIEVNTYNNLQNVQLNIKDLRIS